MKRFFNAAMLTALVVVLAIASGSAVEIESNSTTYAKGEPVPLQLHAQNQSTAEEEEKLTIKQIMKLAHKSGLLKKVATGKATDPETAKLHQYYVALQKLTPPMGGKKSWKEKTEALAKASQAAIDKNPKASEMLKSASDCKACHDVHR